MLPPLICRSRFLRRLRLELPELAASPRPLLIVGEQGVGKTLLAKHIHALAPASRRRLVAANLHTLSDRDRRILLLGAGPPELAGTRRSIFEQPTTILLKSLEELPAYLQESVARILTAGAIRRAGRRAALPVRARVIMALERPPQALLRGGALTPALYDAMRACSLVTIPPLRKRPEDICALLRYWSGAPGRGGARGRRALLGYSWPGNGAELRAHLRSMAYLTHEEALQEHERKEIARIVGMIEERREFSLREALKRVERHLVERAMQSAGGRRVDAARLLGLSERDLRRKVSPAG